LQPGFLGVHLNRSLERPGHFLLIAEWASQTDYRQALSHSQLRDLVRDFPAQYQISLYEPVVGLARPAWRRRVAFPPFAAFRRNAHLV